MIIIKNGLNYLEDKKVPEELMQLSKDVNWINEPKYVNIFENYQLFKILNETGQINKDRIIKEFHKSDSEIVDELVSQNLLPNNQKERISAKMIMIKQVSESMNWRILVI